MNIEAKVDIGKKFNFFGNPSSPLNVDDLIGLYLVKGFVYGFAKVTKCLGNNRYEAIRIS